MRASERTGAAHGECARAAAKRAEDAADTAGAADAADMLGRARSALDALSARLDEARAGDGLPEDRVAATVWKAARAKLERLLALQ